tara:strand:- start:89 stop:514 length:426 start_codon:yes stop_codon:yes gene_type:complete
MSTRSSAFSLIELLVVVAIIGILASVGTLAYNGYVDSAKQSSAENAMLQISLAQTEYLSNTGGYYENPGSSGGNCSPSQVTSREIEVALFDKGDIINEKTGYHMCIALVGTAFKVYADENTTGKPCKLSMDSHSVWTRENC